MRILPFVSSESGYYCTFLKRNQETITDMTANKKNIDWGGLGFNYMPVDRHIRYTWESGKWNSGRLLKKDEITLPIAATCLHYGQACFEGLKAFGWRDGTVRVFRPEENSRRINSTADHIQCPEIPEKLFLDAIKRVIKANMDYVPPYGTKGSLYIRPLLIGTGAGIGVGPSNRYDFIVLVVPVGNYYKEGISPVRAIISEDYDRAAPKGTGHIKMSGNYAASLKQAALAKKQGFPIVLYPDAKTRSCVDEFGTSNFIGITRSGVYVTPSSDTILPSVTNKSLMQIAADLGIPVERREISLEELPEFAEIGACGTAVIITPIGELVYKTRIFKYGNECGQVLRRLYDRLTGIQFGEEPDTHKWLRKI